MSKMTYRKIEEKPTVTINKKKRDLQFIGISPTGEAVFCTNTLSVEDLKSLCVESYNFNDAYFPFNVVLRNDIDLVTSIVLDDIERGDLSLNEEQQIALDRLVDAADGVCYPILMDKVNRSYPEMIKKYNAEKMCNDIMHAVEGAEDTPADSKEEDSDPELKKMTDLEEFMETHNTFDENGKIDLHKLSKAIDDYGPVYFG